LKNHSLSINHQANQSSEQLNVTAKITRHDERHAYWMNRVGFGHNTTQYSPRAPTNSVNHLVDQTTTMACILNLLRCRKVQTQSNFPEISGFDKFDFDVDFNELRVEGYGMLDQRTGFGSPTSEQPNDCGHYNVGQQDKKSVLTLGAQRNQPGCLPRVLGHHAMVISPNFDESGRPLGQCLHRVYGTHSFNLPANRLSETSCDLEQPVLPGTASEEYFTSAVGNLKRKAGHFQLGPLRSTATNAAKNHKQIDWELQIATFVEEWMHLEGGAAVDGLWNDAEDAETRPGRYNNTMMLERSWSEDSLEAFLEAEECCPTLDFSSDPPALSALPDADIPSPYVVRQELALRSNSW
jgi:hypothetical protein